MKEKGKLLVSTKSTGTKEKTLTVIGSVFYLAAAIVFSTEDFADYIGGRGFALLLSTLAFSYSFVNVCLTFMNTKSYCAVYENVIIGRTLIKMTSGQEDFELTYDQIKTVTTTAKQKIALTTAGKTFDVLALVCCEEAVAEIKARIQ